jgi:7-cyano-7-deazaguanine synthase
MTSHVMFSGGPDSVSLTYWLRKSGREVQGIYAYYGQPGGKAERECAERVAAALGIPLKIIDMTPLWDSFSDVSGDYKTLMGGGPCNDPMVLIPLVANWAAWAGSKELYVALHAGDIEGGPFLPELMDAYRRLLPLPGNEFQGFELLTPFIDYPKAEVFRIGAEAGAPLELTWSCLTAPNGTHCGTCGGCLKRQSAFEAASIRDLTAYDA